MWVAKFLAKRFSWLRAALHKPNVVFFSFLMFLLFAALILLLSLIFLNWGQLNTALLSNLLAELIGVFLSALAALPLTVWMIDRYQRRERENKWRQLGQEVVADSIRSLESWVINDLGEISPPYQQRKRAIIVGEPNATDWTQAEAEASQKNIMMFQEAERWLQNSNPTDVAVDNLALIRIRSGYEQRKRAHEELQTELRSCGLDEPELMRQIRRLRQWWQMLGFDFRTLDVDMVLSDPTNPPPDYYSDIINRAKEPISNVIIIAMRQACFVRQMLLPRLPDSDPRRSSAQNRRA